MLNGIVELDYFLTKLILEFPRNLFLNHIFDFLSVKGWWVFIWGLIFLYLFIFEEKRHHKFIIFFISSLIISSFLINYALKNLIQRSRPFHKKSNFYLLNQKNIIKYQFITSHYPNDFSFPSGHAAISFSSATILSFFDKKRKNIFYLVASLIAFSRVYLGYHYFFDIIAGAFLGYLISKLILRIPLAKIDN